MVFHKTREQGEGVEQTGPLLLFRVHIHTIYTGFTHFCRKISHELTNECQKVNYEANNDRNITKLTTHCLYLYQIQV